MKILLKKMHASSKASALYLFLLLPLIIFSRAMAVDHSKFRTCQQTSFCRRHRGQHSARLYKYKLDASTVQVHTSTAAAAAARKEEEETEAKASDKNKAKEQQQHDVGDKDGSVWKSLQRRLLGGEKHDHPGDKSSFFDPYYRGPPTPTLTGTLVNTARETSTKQQPEQLFLAMYCLQDGMVRVRVTEEYGKPGTAYEKPRVTYDELVLDDFLEEHAAARHVVWIQSSDNSTNNNEDNAAAANQHRDLLQKLAGGDNKDLSNYMALLYGDDDTNNSGSMVLLIQLEPFVLSLYRVDDVVEKKKKKYTPLVVLGEEGSMHFEIRREKHVDETEKVETERKDEEKEGEKDEAKEEKKPEKEIVGYWEDGLAIYSDGTREERKEDTQEHRQLTEEELTKLDREGLWDESFNSHTDSKPYGPMSVGMDVAFPQSKHLYGIPEHASSAILQATYGEGAHYQDPYRLYNLDVFEYDLDEPMALYGNVPLVVSQSVATGTTGVFWFNPTETFVDVTHDESKSSTHWMSESGIIDVFLMPGPDPASLYRQYAKLTGVPALPPMFSLGYHQCRWNYKDEKDVYYVHGKFEELDYPYDVLWLDIEHTDGKRYFTWESNLFPHPKEMQEKLASQGRHMVTIIDPHIKRDNDYYIHKEATAKGLYIKDKDGKKDYDGWCWPGSSSYLDFTAEHVRSWWADQFHYSRYGGSSPSLFTWNDMNEPSVFNGPEVSMQKDLRNLKGEEHREWHNLYGMLFHRATAEGQIRRNQPDQDVRPFVLSRAFFAGTQRYGAIWTGDNAAEWGHLEIAAPMLLSLNTCGITFVGADVGGFFGNPDAELFTRWMQAGAYQPFFRGHAHHDSKRREPWMFDEETLVRLRRAAMTRYALLPFWYTVFRDAEITGMPVMRMMWMQYPKTEQLFGIDDQYLIGSDLLVKPVVSAGVMETQVLFPTDDIWYDAESLELVSSTVRAESIKPIQVPSPIDTIPVFQRGGSIIARKLRLRRSSMLMKKDPYTLYVALDNSKKATGPLYMDDEESFGYQKRLEFANSTFTADFSNNKQATLSNAVTVGSGWTKEKELMKNLMSERMIERIIIMGMKASPKTIKVEGRDLVFNFDSKSKLVVIRKPELSALSEWTLNLNM